VRVSPSDDPDAPPHAASAVTTARVDATLVVARTSLGTWSPRERQARRT
jgi:hypothetical protein